MVNTEVLIHNTASTVKLISLLGGSTTAVSVQIQAVSNRLVREQNLSSRSDVGNRILSRLTEISKIIQTLNSSKFICKLQN